MAWYKTGTVAVTNASTTVTGTGTNFVSGAQVGDGFLGPNELLYEITAINSATSLTIAPAYGGATASSQNYAIAPTQGLVATLASDVTDLITDYQSVVDNVGAGKFGDGSAASPAIRFTNDQDTGFFRDTANEIAFATAGLKRGEFSSSGIQLLDGQKFIAGTGNDLSIFHNGSASIIEDSGTGGLTLRSNLFTVQNATGTETVAQFVEDGFVKLFHNNSQVFTTISSGASITGSLGIGTSTPRTGLHLYGAGQTTSAISDAGSLGAFLRVSDTGAAGGAGGGVIFGTNASEADGFAGFAAIKGLLSNGNDRTIGALAFSTRAATTDTALTERMRLTSDGKLGIGTSSISAVLHLGGSSNQTLQIEGSSNTAYYGTNGNRGDLFVNYDPTDGTIPNSGRSVAGIQIDGADGGSNIRFRTTDANNTASTERMRITSAGHLQLSSSTDNIIRTGSDSSRIRIFGGSTESVGNGATLILQGVSHSGGNYADLASATGGYINFRIGTSNAMRLDSSGNLLVGKTSADGGVTTGLQAAQNGNTYITRSSGTANVNTVLTLNRLTSDGDILRFLKDGTTVGSIGVQDDDLWIGEGGVGLQFQNTGPDRVDPFDVANNTVRDNAIDLGGSSSRFDDIYATNGTIQTSDRNEKQDIAELSDAEQRVAVACKGLLRKFRWKDAVAEKGDDARTHFGIIAQDLQTAFAAEGLDAGDYAMFISSTWTDEETGEERTRMGVRYSELLAFIIAAI